ncbi:type III pantothenate kinase [soil metagenome]
MNLAIDIGNKYTKVAVFDGEEEVWSYAYKHFHLDNLKDIYTRYTQITDVIMSDVSGDIPKTEDYIRERSSYMVLNHDTPTPIINRYKTPQTLGRDRIAAVAGAIALYPNEDILVVDAGTCITYEYVNSSREYFGGGISPGLRIRFKALKKYTGKLPYLKKQDIDYLIGGNTAESILSGVINGTSGEINDIISRYREMYPNLRVLVTGGDARFFESYLKSAIFVVPNLVLFGLNKILIYNAGLRH